MAARSVRDAEAPGSNPGIPTIVNGASRGAVFALRAKMMRNYLRVGVEPVATRARLPARQ